MAAALAMLLAIPTMGAAAPLESGEPVPLMSPSAILAEASTGTVVFEKNADEKREVASVTKLMTLLIVLEELEAETIHLEDSVTVSKTAAAMPGSQALLDAGASYPLETLLRSTIIAVTHIIYLSNRFETMKAPAETAEEDRMALPEAAEKEA